MTKIFMLLTFIVSFHSCSVKRDQKPDIRAINSDGDQIMDEEKLNLGRNPLIADLLEMRALFLQDYSISIRYLRDGVERGSYGFCGYGQYCRQFRKGVIA